MGPAWARRPRRSSAAVAAQPWASPSVTTRKIRLPRPSSSSAGSATARPVDQRRVAVPVRGTVTRSVRTPRKAPLCSAARARRAALSSQIRMVGASSSSSTSSKAETREGRRNGIHNPSTRPCSAVVSSSSSRLSRDGTRRASWCRARASRAVKRPGPDGSGSARGSSGGPRCRVKRPSGWGKTRSPGRVAGRPSARFDAAGVRCAGGGWAGTSPSGSGRSGSSASSAGGRGGGPASESWGSTACAAGASRAASPGPPYRLRCAASHTASANSCQRGTKGSGAAGTRSPRSLACASGSGYTEGGGGPDAGSPSPGPDARSRVISGPSRGRGAAIRRAYARHRQPGNHPR